MKNTRGFVIPLLLAIIGLFLVGGGVYIYSQQPKTSDSDSQTFESKEFGFRLEYPAEFGNLKKVHKIGLLLEGGQTKNAPDSTEYTLDVFVTEGGSVLFYVQGSKYNTFSEGAPVQTMLTECTTGFKENSNTPSTIGCERKVNSKGATYYYIDKFMNPVGEDHMALIPLNESSTLVISIPRVDSSELPSTAKDVDIYLKMLDSVATTTQTQTTTPTSSVSNVSNTAEFLVPSTTISVPGMSKYTDTDFGFSFWYPSAEAVTTVATRNNSEYMYGSGTQVLKTISAPDFTIDEVVSPNMSILSSVDAGCCGSPDNKYFFDPSLHTWMEYSDGGSSGKETTGTFATDVAKNTMGGLHILSGYTRFGIKVIIPLSTTHFLAVYSKCNDATYYPCSNSRGESRFTTAIQTFLATDPSVATPVNVANQIQKIKEEQYAYGGE